MQKNSFIYEEKRNDFLVSEKRKKIWLTQLEMLEEVVRICKLYNLKFYAANGTMLGAVKYGGFVPWDDDMDIMMPRNDYDKFVKIVKKELKLPLYFQDGLTEEIYYRMYGRIRNGSTTAITFFDLDRSDKSGIFIDIFPIDGVNKVGFKNQVKKIQIMNKLIHGVVYPNCQGSIVKKFMNNIVSKICMRLFGLEKMKKYLKKQQNKASLENSTNGFIFTHGKPVIIKKQWIENESWVNFEYLKIPLISGYDELLKSQYGDYMNTLPSMEERINHHTLFIDPDKPYSYYRSKLNKEIFDSEINKY